MYDHRNVSEVLSSVEINVAPATLIPFYDEDSSVIFLSAKVWKSVIYNLTVVRFSIEFVKTRTKPIFHNLDYSATASIPSNQNQMKVIAWLLLKLSWKPLYQEN